MVGRLILCWLVVVSGAVKAAIPDVRRDAVVEAISKVSPSVVNISTRTRVRPQTGVFYDWFKDNWSPWVRELPPQESAGSGFIIDESGYIISNVHVIEGAHEVWVKFWDDRPPIRAFPIGQFRKSDVALLKLDVKETDKFSAVQLAQADDLLLGETVIALGNPLGLGSSVSRGILSAKNRRAVAESGQLSIPDWLQTDAAINPGNSGGPLINLKGEVIGINVAISRQGQGIGFAIPIKQVAEALSEFFTPELMHEHWLGIRLKGSRAPFQVTTLEPGSPAEKAGIKAGDLLVEINGVKPANLLEVSNQAHREARLGLLREGRKISVTTRPVSLQKAVEQKAGLTIQELDPGKAPSTLSITEVVPMGPADKADLKTGYYITHIQGHEVRRLFNLSLALVQLKKGTRVELGVLVPVRRAGFGIAYRAAVTELVIN